MQRKVTKAVFPVAGLGTRFLPATKSIPKEIMTLVDRPLIQYAIDEARAAGITEFIFVTSRGKSALEDYFDHAPELEAALREKGKTELLAALTATNMDSGAIAYVRQHRPLGSATPSGARAADRRRTLRRDPARRRDRGREALPPADDRGLCRDRRLHGGRDGSAAAKTSSYGILDIAENGRLVRVKGMVEKPNPGTAPSNLAVIGRYILTPQVLCHLDRMQAGAGGEIQLTDAIAEEIRRGAPVHGCASTGSGSTAARRPGSSRRRSPSGWRDPTCGTNSRYLSDLKALRNAAE
jgi:UTP--glucose-1-phosphate uridylyltransferase